jgi:2-polyprenyl-6-methoxyphenol hydroxylase-like FAD-dependent oxidoreductase
LIAEDVIDANFPHLSATTMPFIVRTPDQEQAGYAPWQMPMNLRTFHWSTLWNNLRKRVPDEAYHRGAEVANAIPNGTESVTLQFKDGSSADFDLVLFADGYQSLGRQLIAPGHGLDYRGYMLWRGLLPEAAMDDSATLGTLLPRVAYTNLQGNLTIYFVPGPDGQMAEGQRIFNWAAYIPIPEADLPEFMVDRDGVAHSGSIPPGKVRLDEEARLKALLCANLPTYYGDIVSKTENTYVQLIYTARIPTHQQGRICVIGDAGMVVQPFTGSGVFKGYNNVKDLLQALNEHGTVEEALQAWDKAQVRIGNRLLALGEQMEEAFVWNPLDLTTADAESTAAWWKAAVTFPEEFSYQAEEK